MPKQSEDENRSCCKARTGMTSNVITRERRKQALKEKKMKLTFLEKVKNMKKRLARISSKEIKR